jgi:hypothetical protein
MWSAKAHPTTRRLARSITVARYAQPSHVITYVMSYADRRTMPTLLAVILVIGCTEVQEIGIVPAS